MTTIDYSTKIPNNVGLQDDRTLQRALEGWLPNYLDWWQDMGPTGSHGFDVYLRTATSTTSDGWATFGHVKMPDYRWGIFLAAQDQDRKVNFGEHKGEAVWQDVPGEHRANLRRIIVTQGDTEPASVEQQRHLGNTAPSQYDLRNLFQVNVEEGRHLWAMVYLLHKHFGRDGREEAEALLERRSGDANREIHFGDHKGEKAWTDVPGEHRANLRRIIVTQGDTEPASVEQQRHLGLTGPALRRSGSGLRFPAARECRRALGKPAGRCGR